MNEAADDNATPTLKWVHNFLAANGGNTVQAGDIHGDVHLIVNMGHAEYETPIVVTSTSSGVEFAVVAEAADSRKLLISGWGVFTVLVEGRSAQAVVLHAIRPVVVRRRPPRPPLDRQAAFSRMEPRRFVIDFDAEQPCVAAQGVDFPFTVSASDPEQFQFTPLSRQDEVEWRFELDWTCAGRNGTTVIESPDFVIYPDLDI